MMMMKKEEGDDGIHSQKKCRQEIDHDLDHDDDGDEVDAGQMNEDERDHAFHAYHDNVQNDDGEVERVHVKRSDVDDVVVEVGDDDE